MPETNTIKEWLSSFLFIIVVCIIIYVITRNANDYKNDAEETMISIPPIPSIKNDRITNSINTPDSSFSWTRTDSCKHIMDATTSKVLEENKAKNIPSLSNSGSHISADIIFPCGYNDIDDEIKALPSVYKHDVYKQDVNKQDVYKQDSQSSPEPKRVFIIKGADEITAKNYLWKNICDHHGLNKACDLSPNTYILSEPQRSKDLVRLDKNHYPGKLYILKKNIQRQTGIEITDDVEKIKNNSDRYVIAQDLLTNSYLVNGRKINLRVYILVVCYKDNTDVYMFNNGFMYYTKKLFTDNDKSNDNHITTGYVERDVYHKNPLTHNDFRMYLDLPFGTKYHESNEPRKLYQNEVEIRSQGLNVSTVVFKRIEKLLADVFVAFKGKICTKIDKKGETVPIYTDYSVQIFGADVAINDQLQPQIIEINKGPDLSPKDDRDGNVKKKLINDVLEVLGLKTRSNDNGLIHILEM
jgi:hypothetical protein